MARRPARPSPRASRARRRVSSTMASSRVAALSSSTSGPSGCHGPPTPRRCVRSSRVALLSGFSSPVAPLHQLPVDGPCGVELFGRPTEGLSGLEELALQFGAALRQGPIGELSEDPLRQEIVGDETGALGVRQAGLGGTDAAAACGSGPWSSRDPHAGRQRSPGRPPAGRSPCGRRPERPAARSGPEAPGGRR